MAKNRQTIDFRFYDMPQRDPVLVFSGEKWKRIYGENAPNLHFHNILEIGICREGSGRMIYENEERPYEAGAISLIPANCPHNTLNEPGHISWWEYIFIDVHAYLQRAYGADEQFMQKCEERIGSRYNLLCADDHPDMRELIDAVIEETNRNEPYMREVRNSYITALLMLMARENRDYTKSRSEEFRARDRQIVQSLKYIGQHYAENLMIADLADNVHMSETHYRRVFRESMNMSPTDYLNMVRIQQACRLLLKTDLPVEIIAERAGFTTMSTFNRNFRSYTNESPLRWKKNHMGASDSIAGFRIRARKGWDDDTV